VGVVRAGIHAFHRGGNVSMLSRMMRRILEHRDERGECPVCHEEL
jgi:hypothetical protein